MTAVQYAELKEQIRFHEGYSPKPYLDTRGLLTIGFGRCLDTKGITRAEAEVLLDNDIVGAIDALTRRFPWFTRLDPIRQRVLVDLCVQLGINGVARFKKTIGFIEAGDFEEAALELLRSRLAEQTPNRAQRLSEMLRSGVAPAVSSVRHE